MGRGQRSMPEIAAPTRAQTKPAIGWNGSSRNRGGGCPSSAAGPRSIRRSAFRRYPGCCASKIARSRRRVTAEIGPSRARRDRTGARPAETMRSSSGAGDRATSSSSSISEYRSINAVFDRSLDKPATVSSSLSRRRGGRPRRHSTDLRDSVYSAMTALQAASTLQANWIEGMGLEQGDAEEIVKKALHGLSQRLPPDHGRAPRKRC